MNQKTRLATTIPAEVDTVIRTLAAERRTNLSAVVTGLLRHALKNPEDPDLIAILDSEVAASRAERASIGRRAMNIRYDKKPED